MGMNDLSSILLRVRWQTERLGTPGKIGLGLFVFSVVFFLVAVSPRQAESSALMLKAETLQARVKAEPVAHEAEGIRPKIMSGSQALKVFYAFFPNTDSTPFWIGEVVQAAAKHGVEINGTEYRMNREKDVKLARYEMVLPVRGQYPQVRGFVADALRAVPALALVDVAIKRESVESELLEANLKFNLYLSEGKK
jgi:Tfp pilus assembly protein PilO